MLFLLELAKIVASVLVIGSLGILSFFNFGVNTTIYELETVSEEAIIAVDLKKVGGEEVGGRPTLPQIDSSDSVEESAPPPLSSADAAGGGGGAEVGHSPRVVANVAPEPEEGPALATTEEDILAGLSWNDVNISARAALVNIICTSKASGALRPISGSGVLIDERGVILTNAHIAQFFLLKDYPIEDSLSCIIRDGSPARPAYRAVPLYVSPAWIAENAHLIDSNDPLGTGEHDFAFLLITAPIGTEQPFSPSFLFLEPDFREESVGLGGNVLLSAYPAGFLSGISIQRNLYAISTVAAIQELFTFVEDTLDLFSIGGSVVAQQGSSGGAVVSPRGSLLGIIVTSSTAESTADRDLRAVTMGHINRSLEAQTGNDLAYLLFGDLALKATVWNTTKAPILTSALVAEIDK